MWQPCSILKSLSSLSFAAKMFRSGAPLALSVGLFASGCYKFVPVEIGDVRPEEEVRVEVTTAAAGRLVGNLGTYRTDIDGWVAPELHDSVSLSVPVVTTFQGVSMASGRQTIFLGRGEVVAIRRRVFSRSKTIVAGVGAAAAFAVLANTVSQIIDRNPRDDDDPPPPPEGLRAPRSSPRLPLFRIPIF